VVWSGVIYDKTTKTNSLICLSVGIGCFTNSHLISRERILAAIVSEYLLGRATNYLLNFQKKIK